ncbi:MAG: hypothetical protein IKE69_02695 [Thermoguttaceae bacterium]|nr:hypothetical protein [Thermoguttaceae bacterium]
MGAIGKFKNATRGAKDKTNTPPESAEMIIRPLYDVLTNFDLEKFAESPLPAMLFSSYEREGRACRNVKRKSQIVETIQKLRKLCRDYIAESDAQII